MSLGVTGIEGHRPSQRFEGASALLRPPERRPEVILRVEELGIDLGRTREGRDGLVDAAEPSQHESASVESRRAVGRQARRPLVVRERVGDPVFALGKAARHEVDAGRVGRPGEQAIDLFARRGELSLGDEPLGPGNRLADLARRRRLRVHPRAARGEQRDAHPGRAAAPARQLECEHEHILAKVRRAATARSRPPWRSCQPPRYSHRWPGLRVKMRSRRRACPGLMGDRAFRATRDRRRAGRCPALQARARGVRRHETPRHRDCVRRSGCSRRIARQRPVHGRARDRPPLAERTARRRVPAQRERDAGLPTVARRTGRRAAEPARHRAPQRRGFWPRASSSREPTGRQPTSRGSRSGAR